MERQDLSFTAATQRFVEYLEGDGKSPLTVAKYRRSLQLFNELTDSLNVGDITKATIRTYKAALAQYKTRRGTELGTRTKNAHLSALRQFLRYLICEEDLAVLAPDRVARLREANRKPACLTADQLQRLLLAPDASTRNGQRDAAMLAMFFSTGMRLSELVSLDRTDINLKTCEIAVRGKGGRVRVVFLSEHAARSLKRYLDGRCDHLDPLFIGRHQNANSAMPPGDEFRLTGRWIQVLVKRYAALAGIVAAPTPHTLRHTFATDLIRNGADLRSVQELLGHADVRTTQVYTHLTSPELRDAHRRFHDSRRE